MITEKPLGLREKEVITILNEYPVLTGKGLKSMLNHSVTTRRLQQILLNLRQKKVIQYLNDTRNGGHGTFYALETHFRNSRTSLPYDLAHSELCSLWKRKLQSLLPDAIIETDRTFHKSPDAKHALLWDGRDREAIPDLLIFSRSKTENRLLSIAVEIEQHHKSEYRILSKVSRFARGTNLDGVIYLSPSHSIPERIKAIYETKVVEKAHRINAYRNHFLLLSNQLLLLNESFQPQNLIQETVDFKAWYRVIQEKPIFERCDTDFAGSTSARRAEPENLNS